MSVIPHDLAPLFAEAEKTGKWFFSPYQSRWFSPAELAAEHAQGHFRWGAVNWRLRDPRERLQELEDKIGDIRREAESFRKRMGG